MIRAAIISATLAVLFCMWGDRPTPVKSVQVDYCKGVIQRGAVKEFLVRENGSPVLDEKGEPSWRWTFGWAEIIAPCSQLDRYENA